MEFSCGVVGVLLVLVICSGLEHMVAIRCGVLVYVFGDCFGSTWWKCFQEHMVDF